MGSITGEPSCQYLNSERSLNKTSYGANAQRGSQSRFKIEPTQHKAFRLRKSARERGVLDMDTRKGVKVLR